MSDVQHLLKLSPKRKQNEYNFRKDNRPMEGTPFVSFEYQEIHFSYSLMKGAG